jgi:hypothetical protein
MIDCLHCGARGGGNGLALCELCQRYARSVFEMLPVYFRNLARWRPGRAGSRPVPGSRVLYDGGERGPGTGDRISDTLDEVANALTTSARMLADDRPHLARLLDRLAAARAAETIDEAQMVAWLCKGFDRFLTSLATLEWCGEFVKELAEHETRLRELTETAVPGWYAGACRHCEAATYVVPGLTWVTCRACGSTTYARDHLETILDEAREWVARPMRLAEAVVALIDTELSIPRLHKRISKWGERGQIEALRMHDSVGDPVGPKRFRLGEVLDRMAAEGATRLSDEGSSEKVGA